VEVGIKESNRMKKTRTRSPQLNEVLEKVKKLAIELWQLERPIDPTLAYVMWGGSFANISLFGSFAEQADQCLEAAMDFIRPAEHISVNAANQAISQVILLGLNESDTRSDDDFYTKLPDALEVLVSVLTSPPQQWQFKFRVGGITASGETTKFGSIEFSETDPGYIVPLLKEDKYTRGQMVARVEVQAFDETAAYQLAMRQLRITADVLNFFTDLLYPPGHTQVVLPGEYEGSVSDYSYASPPDAPDGMVSSTYIGLHQPLSLLWVLRGRYRMSATRLSTILLSPNRTPLEERFLAAIQWAGRATVEPRKEEAFLLYAIALESLVRGIDNQDVTYKFKMRVAHLLGSTVEERLEIFRQVGKLYTIRSKIVHQGSFEVSDLHFNQMSGYTKRCLLRILDDDSLKAMVTDQHLEDWFDGQVLR
jgi:hypothetical protein